MLLAIPTKGRSHRCKTVRFFKSYGTIFCPYAEVNAYKTLGCPVVGVPKHVSGITQTRNWILNHTDERWVVFIDDDMRRAGYVKAMWSKNKRVALRCNAMLDEFQRLFEVAEGVKVPIWGVANNSTYRNFQPYHPFDWHTYVTATCMGIINDGLRFDESYQVYEDYELGLRCLATYGAVVGARYLYFEAELGKTEGGMADYRTGPIEEACAKKLLAAYPGLVRRTLTKGGAYSLEVMDF